MSSNWKYELKRMELMLEKIEQSKDTTSRVSVQLGSWLQEGEIEPKFVKIALEYQKRSLQLKIRNFEAKKDREKQIEEE